MAIKLLPEIVINKLKAGEVVERPASIIKELVENAIDAQANHIIIDIHDGGKTCLIIQDNGNGIEYADAEMVLARYATSKINSDEDLDTLGSYGFRGEALASIAEVSSISVESKTKFADIGFQIKKSHSLQTIEKAPLARNHGTKIIIRDLFDNTPVRKKFLKSNQTEYFYCYQIALDFALVRNDVAWTIKKNGKIVHDLARTTDRKTRTLDIFKKDRSDQLYILEHHHENIVVNGVISNSTLTFGSNQYCKIYVNGRPIVNRALIKAIMEGFRRQIAHGEYPLAIISIDMPGHLVDVNVHPRKLQVKFLEPGAVFSIVKNTIQEKLAEKKVMNSSHEIPSLQIPNPKQQKTTPIPNNTPLFSPTQTNTISFKEHPASKKNNEKNFSGHIVGQIRDSYIILQTTEGIQYIDQHALAERIAFEKLKKEIQEKDYSSQTLLHPLSIQIQGDQDSNLLSKSLNTLQFETTVRGENTLIIYKVPNFLVEYSIDIEKIIRFMLSEKDTLIITIDTILDSIFATKSCKGAIKAGHKLSFPEMQNLIQDGYLHIPGSFVCQHGRPFCIQIDRKDIDKMFDR